LTGAAQGFRSFNWIYTFERHGYDYVGTIPLAGFKRSHGCLADLNGGDTAHAQ